MWVLSDYPSIPGYFPSTFKARNDKLFNGREVSPIDTLQLASVEAECWKKVNLPEDEEEEEARSAPSVTLTSVTLTLPMFPQCPTCQIDASWIDNGTVSGLGWFYKDPMGIERFGLQGCRKSLSALHAEMEGLIWAMSCLRELHCTAVQMETDRSDLVDMIANPTD
ncbi:PREDICTED: uncharacterized protein LOC106339249 [Brassica oleracea var. oleracea]|uniref:uncharacterized protein LOC106339249 n=1 Tax=Brassica oleracea var. oleracea TaxID=109376 RepID=UPI0006A6DB02|nr:PREDICTED: uncharacterized protein LOC106339249 [Brassica oleracea var. oleracea]